MISKYFFRGLSLAIAALFIFAGVGKIFDPAQFAEDIDNYRILPYVLVTISALVLPWLEVFSGICLIFRKWEKGATFIFAMLSFVFLVAITSVLIRGLDISCGCFAVGDAATKINYLKLGENILLSVLTIILYLHTINKGANKKI